MKNIIHLGVLLLSMLVFSEVTLAQSNRAAEQKDADAKACTTAKVFYGMVGGAAGFGMTGGNPLGTASGIVAGIAYAQTNEQSCVRAAENNSAANGGSSAGAGTNGANGNGGVGMKYATRIQRNKD